MGVIASGYCDKCRKFSGKLRPNNYDNINSIWLCEKCQKNKVINKLKEAIDWKLDRGDVIDKVKDVIVELETQ